MQPETALAPTRTASLVAIVSTINQLFDLLDAAETDEERAVAQAEIERMVTTELRDKTDGICWFDKRSDDDVQFLKDRIVEIQEMIVRIQNRKARVREMVRFAMENLGTDRLEGKMHRITLRPGAESVDIVNALELPAQYCRVIPQRVEPDKNRIKAALKAEIEVPGARLVRGEKQIRIS